MTCAVGCKWVRWLGGLLKLGPWAVFQPSAETQHLCKGHQTVVWFQPPHKQTHTHMQTHCPLYFYRGFWGRWLYYSCCNTGLIQVRSDRVLLLRSCLAGSSLNPALTTWMRDTKWSSTRCCHIHQMSLRSIRCHAASDGDRRVLWKPKELIIEACTDQRRRQTCREIGATSCTDTAGLCAVNLELIFLYSHVFADPQCRHIFCQDIWQSWPMTPLLSGGAQSSF